MISYKITTVFLMNKKKFLYNDMVDYSSHRKFQTSQSPGADDYNVSGIVNPWHQKVIGEMHMLSDIYLPNKQAYNACL